MKIIAIAGTNGSGKDTVGQMLADDYGWFFVSVADLLRDEAKKRGLPIERSVLRGIGAEWRREYGLGVLVDRAIKQFEESKQQHAGLVVSPMRNPGEAQRVKDLGGVLVWVDADPKVRYDRITSRNRSTEDRKTFEQFLAEEKAEMNEQGDAATLNMAAVKKMADIFIDNNDGIEHIEHQIKEALNP